jgi:hypothetical protein
MYVTGKSDLLWQGQDEFDGTAGLDNRFHYEVEATEAHIARFTFFFEDAAVRREANFHGQIHRKSSRGATLYIRFHPPSRRAVVFRQSYHCHAIAAMRFDGKNKEKITLSISFAFAMGETVG